MSIGTNDLIQYTLAIDRTDEEVASLYDPLHPAVLHLILKTIRACGRAAKSLSLCGEMAGDPKMTRLLLGMGLRHFSMHPAQLFAVKQQVLGANAARLGKDVAKVMRQDEPERIREMVERLNA